MKKLGFAIYMLAAFLLVVLTLLWGSPFWREWYRFAPVIIPAIAYFIVIAYRMIRGKLKKIDLTLLFSLIILFLAVDRLLWLGFTKEIWMYDARLLFKHRSHAASYWGGTKKRIQINAYGHHDDDFKFDKKPNELRGLMIGDSITMGHRIELQNTFTNVLEEKLKKYLDRKEVQIINTGVQGYDTSQELEVLKRSLKFKPDFIVIGFCMNDIKKPYKIHYDYHGVYRIKNPVLGWFMNETGYAKLLKRLKEKPLEVDQRRILKNTVYSGTYMIQHPDDADIRKAWDKAGEDIRQMAEIAKTHHIPALLAVFPDKMQLHNPDWQYPSKILEEIARKLSIDFLDFTKIWEEKITSKKSSRIYFLDHDHYTQKGHAVVAEYLFQWLKEKEIVQS